MVFVNVISTKHQHTRELMGEFCCNPALSMSLSLLGVRLKVKALSIANTEALCVANGLLVLAGLPRVKHYPHLLQQ